MHFRFRTDQRLAPSPSSTNIQILLLDGTEAPIPRLLEKSEALGSIFWNEYSGNEGEVKAPTQSSETRPRNAL